MTAGEEHITCGYGIWQEGQPTLYSQPPFFEPVQITASGAWTAENALTLVVRLVETPFYHTAVYHFTED